MPAPDTTPQAPASPVAAFAHEPLVPIVEGRTSISKIHITPRLLLTFIALIVCTAGLGVLLVPLPLLRFAVLVSADALEVRYRPLGWLGRRFSLHDDVDVRARPALDGAGCALEVFVDDQPRFTVTNRLTAEDADVLAQRVRDAIRSAARGPT